MKKTIIAAFALLIIITPAFAITYSGSNIPYDSNFSLGLVNGPGTGIALGLDVFFPTPVPNFGFGGDAQIEVTNSNYDSNISTQKYGLAAKYAFSDDFFLVMFLGRLSFYADKAIDYVDSFSGGKYSLDDDTHGSGSYWGLSPNFRFGEFFISPRFIINNPMSGGNIFEVDLNISHKF